MKSILVLSAIYSVNMLISIVLITIVIKIMVSTISNMVEDLYVTAN